MDKNYTHITIVLDNSGSMGPLAQKTKEGLWNFIQEQKTLGKTTVSLYEFNTSSKLIHNFENIEKITEPHSVFPAGGTALLDALGDALTETGQKLSAMPEVQRPGFVLCLIITDGEENSSRRYNYVQIKEMIERQEKVYNWKFNYLGANQDAFKVQESLGFGSYGTQNYRTENIDSAFLAACNSVTRGKTSLMQSGVVEASSLAYTADEITAMNEVKNPEVQ